MPPQPPPGVEPQIRDAARVVLPDQQPPLCGEFPAQPIEIGA